MTKETTAWIDAALKEHAFPLLALKGFRKRGRRAARITANEVFEEIWYNVVNYRSTGCSALSTRAGVGFRSVQRLLSEVLGWEPYPLQLSSDTGHIGGVGFIRGRWMVCTADDLDGLPNRIVSELDSIALPFCNHLADKHAAAAFLLQSRNMQDVCRACAILWLEGERQAALDLAVERMESENARLEQRARSDPLRFADLERLVTFFEDNLSRD